MADMLGIDRRKVKNNKLYQDLKMGNIPSIDFENAPIRVRQLFGKFKYRQTEDISQMYDKSKYLFMLDAPFSVSNRCCGVMKKQPAHSYVKKTGRMPITAQMASESRLRTAQWIKNGCNGFDMKSPISNPMSFWTEQDVLLYIKTHNLPICSVYGDVVFDYDKEGQLEGQMDLSEMTQFGIFDTGRRPLKTTGCDRTGCVLCGFGAHCKGDTRFVDLKETHPKFYNLLDVVKNNGVTYREAIEWVNEHGNLDIKL